MSAFGILVAVVVFVLLYFAAHLGLVLSGVLALLAGLLCGGVLWYGAPGRRVP